MSAVLLFGTEVAIINNLFESDVFMNKNPNYCLNKTRISGLF